MLATVKEMKDLMKVAPRRAGEATNEEAELELLARPQESYSTHYRATGSLAQHVEQFHLHPEVDIAGTAVSEALAVEEEVIVKGAQRKCSACHMLRCSCYGCPLCPKKLPTRKGMMNN